MQRTLKFFNASSGPGFVLIFWSQGLNLIMMVFSIVHFTYESSLLNISYHYQIYIINCYHKHLRQIDMLFQNACQDFCKEEGEVAIHHALDH